VAKWAPTGISLSFGQYSHNNLRLWNRRFIEVFSPPSPQSFSISSARAQVTILPNSTELINLALTANTGFSGTVNVTLSGLPYGVTAAPASAFTLPASGLFWPHGHTGG
jgi:hypothetical protein